MIPDEKLIALYTGMLKCRMISERARALKQHVKLARHVNVIPGEESLLAGISADLLPGDTIISSSRSSLPALLNGASLKVLLANQPHNGNNRTDTHAIAARPANGSKDFSPPAGGLMQTACSAARAYLQTPKRRIAIALFRAEDGNNDRLRRSLREASRENLPLVFVRKTSPPQDPANAETNTSSPPALASGVPIIAVDASDVLAVYRVAGEAIARARHGRGPTLIDCVGSAYARSLQPSASNRSRARPSDAIASLESSLKERRISPARLRNRVERELVRQLDHQFQTLRR